MVGIGSINGTLIQTQYKPISAPLMVDLYDAIGCQRKAGN